MISRPLLGVAAAAAPAAAIIAVYVAGHPYIPRTRRSRKTSRRPTGAPFF
ncbi:MAG: hypothetical protein M3R21_07155 [Candidatus Dormibacteraeota bacterium]|nr:hypothetical protein [Candidatus Dormibacteraeota bacterium]